MSLFINSKILDFDSLIGQPYWTALLDSLIVQPYCTALFKDSYSCPCLMRLPYCTDMSLIETCFCSWLESVVLSLFSEQTHVYRSIVASSVVLDRVEGGAKIFEFQMNQKPTRNSSPQKQGKHYQPLFSTAKQFFCSKL